MMVYEDIKIQLVDLPPVTPDYAEYWVVTIIQNTDLVLLVHDLSEVGGIDHLSGVIARLEASRIRLRRKRETDVGEFGISYKSGLLVGNKADLVADTQSRQDIRARLGTDYPSLSVSAATKEGLERLRRGIFEALEIVRVYTKEPGKPADLQDPLVLNRGSTVKAAARALHKDFAHKLRFARIWGKGAFDGQRVEWDHVVQDKDILEFHI
jgi:ribosome-interacting GTPase 1